MRAWQPDCGETGMKPIELCKQYEHNSSHWKLIFDNTIYIRLAELVRNRLVVFVVFCSIGTEQELEKLKYLSMAPPAKWVMVH